MLAKVQHSLLSSEPLCMRHTRGRTCRCAAAAAAAAQEATVRLRAEVSEVEERSGDNTRALLTQHEQVHILGDCASS
jgi:UDP-N-acetylmuramyl pentapeptide synthase